MECRSPSRPAQHLSMGGLLSGKGCREQRLFSVLRRNLNAFHSPSYLPFTLGTHTCGLGPGHLAREGGRAMLRAHPACTVRALLLPWTRLSRVCWHASDSAPLGPQSRKGPVPQGFAAHSPCPSHTAGSISGPLRMAPVWGRLEMGASLSVPQALDLACLRRGSAPHLLHPCSSRTRGGHPASPRCSSPGQGHLDSPPEGAGPLALHLLSVPVAGAQAAGGWPPPNLGVPAVPPQSVHVGLYPQDSLVLQRPERAWLFILQTVNRALLPGALPSFSPVCLAGPVPRVTPDQGGCLGACVMLMAVGTRPPVTLPLPSGSHKRTVSRGGMA